MMKLFMLFGLSLCVLYIQVINGIVINDLVVPNMVTIDDDDTNDNIRVDCNYELSDNPSSLVVKWFKNGNAIYQWIRGQSPSVMPTFKDHIEITATSEDSNHEYSGFILINPSSELSGTYKCVVQTNNDSKSKEKQLHIVDISNHTTSFQQHQAQNETHLKCAVYNVFPKPTMHLESDNDMIAIINNDTKIILNENKYYDAVMTAVAQSSDSQEKFYCYASFEGLPLNISANALASDTGYIMKAPSWSSLLLLFLGFTWSWGKLL